ncbi:hypothetical protein L596_026197 [Steinernema carpocapsae]|uniref:Uncharacterized protein n=1 Tax=Steinernema carpocapsae TaxID=34508 RepID=A0A4U5M0M7_STECR|nr:hypothetical protein L596_026197 [Steinernema carpocapsae]
MYKLRIALLLHKLYLSRSTPTANISATFLINELPYYFAKDVVKRLFQRTDFEKEQPKRYENVARLSWKEADGTFYEDDGTCPNQRITRAFVDRETDGTFACRVCLRNLSLSKSVEEALKMKNVLPGGDLLITFLHRKDSSKQYSNLSALELIEKIITPFGID